MSNLNELNALRTAAGMKPLKSWKESKAKLDAAIEKLTTEKNVISENDKKVAKDVEVPAKAKVEAKTAKPDVKKTPAKAKPAKEKKTPGEGVSISTIAAELGIDPKVARAKLRRQDEVPCIEGSQWLFLKSDIPAIKTILQGDARKKA